MGRRVRVYIACPLTSSGDLISNCREATKIWNNMVRSGYAPFNPAANDFAAKMAIDPDWVPPYEMFMDYDFSWLLACDCLFRLPGYSRGASREVRFANKHGIPVFYDWKTFRKWADKRTKRLARYSKKGTQ